MTEPQARLRTDVLIPKVNNRLQASLRTLRGNHYITITGCGLARKGQGNMLGYKYPRYPFWIVFSVS